MKKQGLVLFFVFTLLFSFSAQAKDIPEHPLIRPFPGSVLAKNISKYNKFNQYEFYFKNDQTGKREKQKVQGQYWYLVWEVLNPDGSRVQDISTLEFFENYKAAAAEKGGKVVWEDSGQVVFTLPRDDGGTTWCRLTVNSSLGQQFLVIIDEKPFKKSLTFGPAEMKAALDKDGHIALYDILFDFDRATLKEESLKQLSYVVTLLRQNPDLNVEIQGHTDSQGSDEYNLDLSQQRAETVQAFALLFGVEPGRLAAKGYGESVPVATNDTEEGRAKNRRVELVKQ